MHRHVAWRRAFARGTAALLATLVVASQSRTAAAAPGDIFEMAAPALGSDPPKATDIKTGDASVATRTGQLEYSYPILVPPGRLGAQPSLSLTYSSQAPTYGGVAAGWSLPVPMISEDVSQSRLRTHDPLVELTQSDPAADDRFVSSLAGGRPLIRVDDPKNGAWVYQTYRAQNDSSFARYQRMYPGHPYRWSVLSSDGTTYFFGDGNRTVNCPVSDGFAPLTRTVDSFGNEVAYNYTFTSGECLLTSIEYGQNATAGLGTFARVDFTYNRAPLCAGIPAGSQTDYRTGTKIITGANVITRITATAIDPSTLAVAHTRQVTLGYDATAMGCTAGHAPMRLLTSIQESAWGASSTQPRVDLPAVTFTYGDLTPILTADASSVTPWGTGEVDFKNTLSWGFRSVDDRWPTVEAMLVDLDGDGILDRLVNQPFTDSEGHTTDCGAIWQRGTGFNPTTGRVEFEFATRGPVTLPRLKWMGPTTTPTVAGSPTAGERERCSLNGQATAYKNSYEETNTCHDDSSCQPGSDPNAVEGFCYPGGTECPAGLGDGPDGQLFYTQLAYRWIDADGDGLTDLVAAVHGDIDYYDIERGNIMVPDATGASFNAGEPSMFGIPGFGQWPACPGTGDRCEDLTDCMDKQTTCGGSGPCTTDWSTVLGCLAGTGSDSPTVPCGDLMFGPGPTTPPGGGSSGTMVTRGPYQRCEGLYPWLIYKNQGNGVFASTPTIKYQPIPLESDMGDSSLTGPVVASSDHGVMDLDGDGISDAVAKNDASSAGPNAWQVWFGDGTGGFLPNKHVLATRPHPDNSISGVAVPSTSGARSDAGTLDINGDGAPDHWLHDDIVGNANIAFLAGTGYQLFSGYLGEVTTSSTTLPRPISPAADTWFTITEFVGGTPHTTKTALAGTTVMRSRPVDVDNDGRVDVVEADTTGPKVFYNAGGNFVSTAQPYPGDASGVERVAAMTSDGLTTMESQYWELDNDLVDLDGNGIPEAIAFTSGSYHRAAEQASMRTNPPRLLKTIDNGRGAVTSITYASMHDADVVTQAPELTWWDGRPKASPRAGWVVRGLSTVDSYASTTTTTGYTYTHPRFAADDEGRYGFRGFEEVATTNTRGTQTLERFGYDVDWSGRRIASIVYPAEGQVAGVPTGVHTIDRTHWEARTLFASDSYPEATLTTYHATETEHIVCGTGETEASCTLALPSSAAAYTKTVSTLTALDDTTHTTQPLLWQETTSRLQSGVTPATGDRATTTTYALFANASNYRLRSTDTQQFEDNAGTLVPYARSSKTWDADYKTQLTDEVWVDATPANKLVTTFEYFPSGNLKSRQKPNQTSAGGPKTTYAYDARQLFTASETNELGHVRQFTWEYGTGTKVQTDGPNTRTCSTCPVDATHPVKEQDKLVIDGLGRTLEHWISVGDTGASYTVTKVETHSYFEGTSSAPASVTTSKRIDDFTIASPQWSLDQTLLDGHGRPSRVTTFVLGTAPANAVTTYQYANDGTLVGVTVPDPTSNTSATVAYTYAYDSLGRPTSIRRPDASNPADRSGVDITYDGMTQTTTEVVKANDGNPASTKTFNDAFGRLVRVDEKSDASTWQTTTYEYGPDDRVRRITDPEGVKTALTHDWAGRRTMITRPGGATATECTQLVGTSTCRWWKYFYDRNGNELAEAAPSATSATDLNYVTWTVYDDLDRSTEKLLAPRTLSPSDLALFGSHELFYWDLGGNGIGRLKLWALQNPSSGSVASSSHSSDAQGNPYMTAAIFQAAGYSLSRSVYETWSPLGTRTLFKHGEKLGAHQAETWTRNNLDARGLPKSLEITNRLNTLGTQTSSVIGEQTRNVAGLVTERRSNVSTSMAYVYSRWLYDPLGRVVDQDVRKGPSPTPVARQHLEYFGNDDPKTLMQRIDGLPDRTLTFGYDYRHQITSADADLATYFHGAYAYGDAGRLTNATVEQSAGVPGSEVWPRKVSYVYGGADPEQVTALVYPGAGTADVSFSYDPAGNETSRSVTATGETLDYVYDGKNQLRRVTRKLSGVVQGSEEYWYDENGTRTQVLKRDAAGTKTGLVYFLKDSEFHYDATGALTETYAHASMGTPVARIERKAATADTPTTEFQFHGLASNTIATVSSTGTVNAAFRYAPFGEVLEATNAGGSAYGTPTHKRRFNDKYQDDISGLTYYGFRYYDKLSMTWTQSDPLYRFSPDAAWTSPRKANLYVSDLNNPIRYIDPDGRQSFPGFSRAAAEWNSLSKTATKTAETTVDIVKAISEVPRSLPAFLFSLTDNADLNPDPSTENDGPSCPLDDEEGTDLGDLDSAGVSPPGGPGAGLGIGPIINGNDSRENVIYEVPGDGTRSGKPYVGQAKDLDKRTRDTSPGKKKADGRDRSKAKVVDHYTPGNRQEARVKEQAAIDKHGLDNLDNKRNEIAPKKKQ